MTRFAINHPLPTLMGVLAVVLMGIVAYTKLNVDRFPPLSFPIITVTVGYPQAAAQDVEQLVAQPIEDALSGVEGMEMIESTSREGRAQIRLTLAQGTDPNLAALDVERRISRIMNRLPADITPPSIQKADPNEIPVLNISLAGVPLDELNEVAENQILPAIESVLGVASAQLSGGLVREVQVRVDYNKLAAYNLSVTQLQNSLVAANVTSTVGSVENGFTRLNVRAVGAYQSVEELRNTVVFQSSAGPVLLRDVAVVEDGFKVPTSIQRINGQDAVGISVVKASTANALEVTDGVKATLKRLESVLPAGTQLYITNDNSSYTRHALNAVQFDLGLAVILVALVVLIFLHAWRNVLIIVLAIPTSLISTCLVMFFMGFSLNLMTLMALALVVGVLVDDSTVVIENIHRHLQMGESPKEAALRGRNEIGMAAMAITAADIVVYLPVAFMSGLVGQLFKQYGLTIVIATLFSFLVSFTLTPMLASRWLKHENEGRARGPLAAYGRWWDNGFDAVGRFVERLVPVTVHLRWLVVVFGIGMLVSVAVMIQTRTIGTEYSPGEDTDTLFVNINTPPGTSLARIEEVSRQVEEAIMAMDGVLYVTANVSVASPTGPSSATGGFSRISVQLEHKKERSRSVFDIAQDVRGLARRIPDARITPNLPSSLPGGGGSGGLNFDVSGPDIDVLNGLVAQLREAVSVVPGLSDITDTSEQGTPEVQIVFDSVRMAQMGVTTQQATAALRTTLGGLVVTELRRPGKLQQDITIIAGDVDRTDLNKLASIPIKGTVPNVNNLPVPGALNTQANNPIAMVTLGQVATIRPGTGPVQIQRTNRNRNIAVSGTAVGRSLGDVAADVQDVLKATPAPPGYTVVPGRSVNQFTQALTALLAALVLALILEYMLLVALYESWFYPFVLLLSVPLGLVGSMLGLWVTGNTINIFSLMGLVMAFGLVAKNGILLVDFTNLLRKQGLERTQALAQAARTRLRPILMTSCTMIFGMLPLAFKAESGGESRAPMAVVVIGAVLTSTLLAVFVLPAMYTLFDDLQGLFSRRPKLEPVHVPEGVPGRPERVPEPVLASVGAPSGEDANGGDRRLAAMMRRLDALRARRRAERQERMARPSEGPA